MPCEGANPFSKQFPIFPPITNTHLHAGEGQEDNDLLTQYLYKYFVGPYGTLWVGFMVLGLGFRVWGLGLGFRVWGLGLGFRV